MGYTSTVDIYTDGACSGNPGSGGWACILLAKDKEKVFCGGENPTTNNRMELMAALEALKKLKKPCIVNMYSDSRYLVDAFNKNWVGKWMQNGWLTSGRQAVKNQELWVALLEWSSKHRITWIWVKGHANNPYNERCDTLAREALAKNRDQ